MHAKFFYIVVTALYIALLWPLDHAYSQSELRHFRVKGAIVDSAGQPVAGAIALGEQNQFTDVLDRGAKSAVSDATGRFSLEFDVQVSPAALWLPIRVYKPGCAIAQRNFGVRREQPDEVELSFELEPAHARTVCLVDSHDQPIAGAKLAAAATQSLQFSLDAEVLSSLGIDVPSSDEAGLIEIPWLSADGEYDLRFEHPEFAHTMAWRVADRADPPRVCMERGNEVEFAFIFPKGLQAPQGGSVMVRVQASEGSYSRVVPLDAQGRGKTRLANGQNISLQPRHPTLATMGSEQYRGIRMNTFVLYEKGSVRGRVINAANMQGVEGVSVHCTARGKMVAATRTQADGSYELSVPAIAIEVTLDDGTEWKSENQSRSLQVKPSSVHELDDFSVRAKLPLRGRVVYQNKPVPYAIVGYALPAAKFQLADAEGNFEIAGEMFGSHTVLLAMHPYEPRSIVVQAADKEQQDLKIALSPEGSLLGRIVDFQDKPLAGQRIDLWMNINLGGGSSMSTQGWQFAVSRQDGSFRFQGLSEGLRYAPTVDGKQHRQGERNGGVAALVDLSDARSKRVPLKISQELQREIESMTPQQPMPAVFQPQTLLQHATMLANTEPLTEQTFSGKSVLICYGWWPLLIGQLELAHQLYHEQGLTIVCIVPRDTPTIDANWAAQLAAEPLPFPIVVDDGELAKLYSLSIPGSVALYGTDGRLRQQLTDLGTLFRLLPTIRQFMVYK